jgi:hypothetical protein
VLIQQLPRDSAFMRAEHGEDVIEWTLVVEQLSQIKSQLAWANWQRAGKRSNPKPQADKRPGRRPGIRHGGKLTRPQAEVKALLDSYSYRAPTNEVVVRSEHADESAEVTDGY